MRLTEARIKQIIREEVENRLREYYEEQVMQMLIDEGILDKIRQAEIPDSWKRVAGILGIGAVLVGGTMFGSEYASYAQEKSLENQIGQVMQDSAEKVKGLKNFRHLASIPDSAGAPVGEPIVNAEQASQVMEDFQFDHIDDWASATETLGPGPGLPTEGFGFVPADQIGDNEVLPFVGMTKADYETFLRAFYLDDPGGQGDQRLEDLVMGGGERGSSMYWSYGGGDYPAFSFFNPSEDVGKRGMMLPPEWSVAYDLLQTRGARAAGLDIEPPSQTGGIPLETPSDDRSIPLGQTTYKEMKIIIKKELAKLL
jgi:hypothetical protein